MLSPQQVGEKGLGFKLFLSLVLNVRVDLSSHGSSFSQMCSENDTPRIVLRSPHVLYVMCGLENMKFTLL
jgi:hypothetical protein